MIQENLILKTKIELFLALLAEDHQAPVLDELVAALVEDDRPDQAAEVLYWALDHGRDDLANRLRLVELLLAVGRTDEAGQVLGRAKSLVDDAVSKMDWIARLEHSLGQGPEEALTAEPGADPLTDGGPADSLGGEPIEDIDLDQDLVSLAQSGDEIDLQEADDAEPVKESDLAALLLTDAQPIDAQPIDAQPIEDSPEDLAAAAEVQLELEPLEQVEESELPDEADDLSLAGDDSAPPDRPDQAAQTEETEGDWADGIDALDALDAMDAMDALDALLIDQDQGVEADDPATLQAEAEEGGGAADESADLDEGLTSPTIADLYLDQGHQTSAIEVYRKLLKKDPRNRAIRAKLKSLGGMPDNWALPRMLDILSKWRSLISGRTEPV